jgi:hypothetical protein
MRDIDTEELINELQKKNTELELQNRRLKENVTFLHILCSLVSNCCQRIRILTKFEFSIKSSLNFVNPYFCK